MNSETKTLRIFQVATAILAVAALALGAWGISTNNKLDNAEVLASTEKTQLGQATGSAADLTKELASQKQEFDTVSKNLKLDEVELSKAAKELAALRASAKKAAEESATAEAAAKAAANDAAKEKAHLEAQVAAAEATSKLASACAKTLAAGLEQIYDNPTPDTLKQVGQLLTKATEQCTKFES